jgi:hypothetical protein
MAIFTQSPWQKNIYGTSSDAKDSKVIITLNKPLDSKTPSLPLLDFDERVFCLFLDKKMLWRIEYSGLQAMASAGVSFPKPRMAHAKKLQFYDFIVVDIE